MVPHRAQLPSIAPTVPMAPAPYSEAVALAEVVLVCASVEFAVHLTDHRGVHSANEEGVGLERALGCHVGNVGGSESGKGHQHRVDPDGVHPLSDGGFLHGRVGHKGAARHTPLGKQGNTALWQLGSGELQRSQISKALLPDDGGGCGTKHSTGAQPCLVGADHSARGESTALLLPAGDCEVHVNIGKWQVTRIRIVEAAAAAEHPNTHICGECGACRIKLSPQAAGCGGKLREDPRPLPPPHAFATLHIQLMAQIPSLLTDSIYKTLKSCRNCVKTCSVVRDSRGTWRCPWGEETLSALIFSRF